MALRRTNRRTKLVSAVGLGEDKVLQQLVDLGHLEAKAANVVISDMRDRTNSALKTAINKSLEAKEKQILIDILAARFEANMHRHKKIKLDYMVSRLRQETPDSLIWSLDEMEKVKGEPDVIAIGRQTKRLLFATMSPESPEGLRNCAYDKSSQDELIILGQKPTSNAVDLNAAMGTKLWSAKLYTKIQSQIESLDQNSYCWIFTPIEHRKRGLAYIVGFNKSEIELEYAYYPVSKKHGTRASLVV